MSGAKRRPRRLWIAIIGAGPGGPCMAVRLRQAGFEDFVLPEKGDGVGGTWSHNRHRGCACDIPSYLPRSPSRSSATGRSMSELARRTAVPDADAYEVRQRGGAAAGSTQAAPAR
jgi:cation diffusion facilitator CzcD-associated flavoprotein CzcO